jgi:hypothetical protein
MKLLPDSLLEITQSDQQRHEGQRRKADNQPSSAQSYGRYRIHLARLDVCDAIPGHGEARPVESSAKEAITSSEPIIDLHSAASYQHDRAMPGERTRRVRRDRHGTPAMTRAHEQRDDDEQPGTGPSEHGGTLGEGRMRISGWVASATIRQTT